MSVVIAQTATGRVYSIINLPEQGIQNPRGPALIARVHAFADCYSLGPPGMPLLCQWAKVGNGPLMDNVRHSTAVDNTRSYATSNGAERP